eukprot:1946147-Prorocentrum_lima.AAC.1
MGVRVQRRVSRGSGRCGEGMQKRANHRDAKGSKSNVCGIRAAIRWERVGHVCGSVHKTAARGCVAVACARSHGRQPITA